MINKYINDITDTEWQVVTLNKIKYIIFKAKSNGKALIRQVKEDKTVGEYINYRNYKYYLKKPSKSDNKYYCRRCGHDKRSIYHKVFSSCARHKRSTYNQGALFNNYLAAMPEEIMIDSDYYNNVYQDNYIFANNTDNIVLKNNLRKIRIMIPKDWRNDEWTKNTERG